MRKAVVVVDSRDRDREAYPQASEFAIDLPTALHGVVSVALDSWVVPQCPRTVDDHNRDFSVTVQWDPADPASRRTYAARLPRMQAPSDATIALAAEEAVRALPAFAADRAALAPALYDPVDGRWEILVRFSSTDLRLSVAVQEVHEKHFNNVFADNGDVLEYYGYRSLPVAIATPSLLPDAARLWGLDPVSPAAESVAERLSRVYPPGGDTAPSQVEDWHVAQGDRALDAEPDHVAIHVEEIGGHPAFGGNGCTDKAVAMLLSTRKSGLGFDHHATAYGGGPVHHDFIRPIHRLRRLRIRVLAPDGRPVDVRGRDLLLAFEFRVMDGAT